MATSAAARSRSWFMGASVLSLSMHVVATEIGFYCSAGEFHVDPIVPVPCAVLMQAHADRISRECGEYLCAVLVVPFVRCVVGDAKVRGLAYSETTCLGDME